MGAANKRYEVTFRVFSSAEENGSSWKEDGQFRTKSITDVELYPVYRKCSYIVRNRMRASDETHHESLDQLEMLLSGFMDNYPEFAAKIASADVVEVEIPFEDETVGWSARLFPWEEILSLTAKRSKSSQLVVVRYLECNRSAVQPKDINEASLVRLQSTPGALADLYSFQSESNIVHDSIGVLDNQSVSMVDPTRTEFLDRLNNHNNDIIHLSVLDTVYFDAEFPKVKLGDSFSDVVKDGIVLAGEGTSPYDAIHYSELEKIFSEAMNPVELVSFATCYSADRLAPMTVSGGAHAALGFRGLVYDDVVGEYFRSFYSSWRDSNWDILAAFTDALRTMRTYDPAIQSTPVLYSDYHIVGKSGSERPSFTGASPAPNTYANQIAISDTNERNRPAASEREQPGQSASVDFHDEPEVFDPSTGIDVKCHVQPEISYSALHNQRPIFQVFKIHKKQRGAAPPVEVCVELIANGATETWKRQYRLKTGADMQDVARDQVSLALGSDEIRKIQESTWASLMVSVSCGGFLCYQDTHSFRLLPVDQWHDSQKHWQWLPSFIQPRDPAVLVIIKKANRYLKALADDSDAGFDGYQQADDFPEIADLQARAIWSAISYDFGFEYVNPPPTYVQHYSDGKFFDPYKNDGEKNEFLVPNQRLRFPSQILEEGRGTCIDLALLFASCLEYIGLYPAIVLIAGHAFPGWWRDEHSHAKLGNFQYLQTTENENVNAGDGLQTEASLQSRYEMQAKRELNQPWVIERSRFPEVINAVSEGGIAVIETTRLCSGGSFSESVREAYQYISDPSIFDALIDVQTSREHPVTPLPIIVNSNGR